MISAYCADSECCTILIRIFNLTEFGICGFMPLIAPLLLIPITILRFPAKWKRLTAIVITISDAVCIAVACDSAYAWLTEISAESVRFYPICVIYGLMMIVAALIIVLPAKREDVDND